MVGIFLALSLGFFFPVHGIDIHNQIVFGLHNHRNNHRSSHHYMDAVYSIHPFLVADIRHCVLDTDYFFDLSGTPQRNTLVFKIPCNASYLKKTALVTC